MFAAANKRIPAGGRAYALELVTSGGPLTFNGDAGLTISADGHYQSLRGAIDTLVVPGGSGPQSARSRALLNWLRREAKHARRVVSICTGAFLLARAGVLEGKHATTHWMFAEKLSSQHPRTLVEPDRIFVQDGRVYTSAGVTAGMDLALALVQEDLGSAVALEVARALVLFLRRPGGQTQFSTLLSLQASEHKPLVELTVWIAENLREDLSVESLAVRVAMSPRNFARVFAREFRITPARFVEELRLDACRRKLETTTNAIDEIAEAAGFASTEVMRRAFERCLGTSPRSYREHFR